MGNLVLFMQEQSALSGKKKKGAALCSKSDCKRDIPIRPNQIKQTMKRITLLLAFIALLATVSQAATTEINAEKATASIYQKENVTFKVAAVADDILKEYNCTVTTSWTNDDGTTSSVTVTVKCGDCTSQQSACDKAYKIASIVIPD